MNRCDSTRLQDFLLGELAVEETAVLQQHLGQCSHCARLLEQYRTLFADLADLPMPPLPAGISEEVVARLQPQGLLARGRRSLASPVARPVFASLTGIVAGLLVALFREPLTLFAGEMVKLVLTGWTAEILRNINTGIAQFNEWTVILGIALHWILKFGSILHALAEVAPTALGQALLLSIVLTLAMALLLGRLVGHLRREEFGHAKR